MQPSPSKFSTPGTARFGQRSISSFRFHHMLVRFSRDVGLLDQMAKVELDQAAAADAVEFIVDSLNLPLPVLSFSRRRRHADGTPTGTGLTIWSINDLVAMHGPAAVEEWRRAGALDQHLTDQRVIRLGDPTLLVSAAHEVAHIHVAERNPGAPAHGKVFVVALDDSAAAAAFWLGDRYPRLAIVPSR
jgi:hypothetical protein